MSRYKIKENDFKTPPENVYVLDLTGIDEKEGKKGPYLRWRWEVAEVPGQEEYAGAFCTSLTSTTPTMNNRFGQFLKVILADAQVGVEGDTSELLAKKVRIKGFVEHNVKVEDGEEITYCNVNKLLEGSVQMGQGIGPQELKKPGDGKKQGAPGVRQEARSAAKPQAEEQEGEIPW